MVGGAGRECEDDYLLGDQPFCSLVLQEGEWVGQDHQLGRNKEALGKGRSLMVRKGKPASGNCGGS